MRFLAWSIFPNPVILRFGHYRKPNHLKERKPSMRSRSIGLYIVVTFASVQGLFSSQNLTLSEPESVGMASDRLSLIGKTMQEYVDNRRIPGAVTLVARRGKIVHLQSRGWSNIEAQTPLGRDSIFRIASMTKPIVSVALMMP